MDPPIGGHHGDLEELKCLPHLLPLSAGTCLQRSQSSVYLEGDHSLDPPIGGHHSAIEELRCQPHLLPLSAGTPLQRSQSSGYSEGDHSLDPPIGGNQSAVEERKCQPCDVPQASPTFTRDMASILEHSGIYETSINTKPSSASDITDSDSSDQPRADWQRHQSSTGGLDHH